MSSAAQATEAVLCRSFVTSYSPLEGDVPSLAMLNHQLLKASQNGIFPEGWHWDQQVP
jgi:hypothetical protein